VWHRSAHKDSVYLLGDWRHYVEGSVPIAAAVVASSEKAVEAPMLNAPREDAIFSKVAAVVVDLSVVLLFLIWLILLLKKEFNFT